MFTILYWPRFVRNYKKLPGPIRKLAQQKEEVFRKNPFHPSLKTHKFGGSLDEYWAFSINYSYRIIFRFEGKNKILFFSIGTHNIYE